MDSNAQAALIGAIVGALISGVLQIVTSYFRSREERHAVARSIIQDIDILRNSLSDLYAEASGDYDETSKRKLSRFKIFEPINLSNSYKIAPYLSEPDKDALEGIRYSLGDCETTRQDILEGTDSPEEVAAYWSSLQSLIADIDRTMNRLRYI